MKKCPNCQLTNPLEAEKCDCGYNFSLGVVEKTNVPQDKSKNSNPLFYAYSVIINGLAGLALLVIFIYSKNYPYRKMQNIVPPEKYNSISDGIFWYLLIGYAILVLTSNYVLCKRMKKKRWFLHLLINLLMIPVFLMVSIVLMIK